MDNIKRFYRLYYVVIYYNILIYYRIFVVKNIGWGDLLVRIDYVVNSIDGLDFGRGKFFVIEYEGINVDLLKDKGVFF